MPCEREQRGQRDVDFARRFQAGTAMLHAITVAIGLWQLVSFMSVNAREIISRAGIEIYRRAFVSRHVDPRPLFSIEEMQCPT